MALWIPGEALPDDLPPDAQQLARQVQFETNTRRMKASQKFWYGLTSAVYSCPAEDDFLFWEDYYAKPATAIPATNACLDSFSESVQPLIVEGWALQAKDEAEAVSTGLLARMRPNVRGILSRMSVTTVVVTEPGPKLREKEAEIVAAMKQLAADHSGLPDSP